MATPITCIEKDCQKVTTDHYDKRCRDCHERWVRQTTKHDVPYHEQNNGTGPKVRGEW